MPVVKEFHKAIPNPPHDEAVIWRFMSSFEKGRYKNMIESVEFKYKNKLVRLYDKGVHNECFMLDNWFNLDNKIFDNWPKGFEPEK